MQRIAFAKGHGTENDFVIIPDPDGELRLTDADVIAICDRRTGIGADGMLRVVRSDHVAECRTASSAWFMDYRNADGSTAQMCGNGIRVFARYLIDVGWSDGPVIAIATRDGVKQVTACADDRFRVFMGRVTVRDVPVRIQTVGSDVVLPAIPAEIGTPHAVAFVDDLDAVSLQTAPTWSPAERFPNGVNIEFVRWVARRHLAMRVHERGSQETRSCGTGACAAAAAAAYRAGDAERPVTYRMDVRGGRLDVELTDSGCELTGPAAITASGMLTLPRRGG